jgi:hypothetical protein
MKNAEQALVSYPSDSKGAARCMYVAQAHPGALPRRPILNSYATRPQEASSSYGAPARTKLRREVKGLQINRLKGTHLLTVNFTHPCLHPIPTFCSWNCGL